MSPHQSDFTSNFDSKLSYVEVNGKKLPTLIESFGELKKSDVKFISSEESYKLPRAIWVEKEKIKEQIFRNFVIPEGIKPGYVDEFREKMFDEEVGLTEYRAQSYSFEDGKLTITLQEITHLQTRLSNLAAGYTLENGKTIREHFFKEATPLEKSAFANPLGINALIIGNDGLGVLEHKIKNKLSLVDNIISCSLTGVYPQQEGGGAWEQLTRHVVTLMQIREANILDISLVGMSRDLIACGVPELHFIIKVDQDFETTAKNSFRKVKTKTFEAGLFSIGSRSDSQELANVIEIATLTTGAQIALSSSYLGKSKTA